MIDPSQQLQKDFRTMRFPQNLFSKVLLFSSSLSTHKERLLQVEAPVSTLVAVAFLCAIK